MGFQAVKYQGMMAFCFETHLFGIQCILLNIQIIAIVIINRICKYMESSTYDHVWGLEISSLCKMILK